MANFWSSTFAFPNQFFAYGPIPSSSEHRVLINALLRPTYSPWFHHQGVTYAPVWTVPCYSQYQQPLNAAINPLESDSSSSSEDENEPLRIPGPSNPRRQRSPNNAQGPQTQLQLIPRSGNKRRRKRNSQAPNARHVSPPSPNAAPNLPAPSNPAPPTTVTTPTLSRIRSTRAADYASKGLREVFSSSPSTFTVLSPLVYKRERPANWRPDYLPPSASWMKRRLVGFKTMLTEEPSYSNRSLILNTLLLQPTTSPLPSTYYYDLRCNPFSAYLLHLPHSNGPINHLHLVQVATMPPTHDHMHIWHHRFPWVITVRSMRSNGILVSDVLGTIYAGLMTPITSRDYYNADMTAEDRERVEAAYKRRCNGDVGLLKRGILRVDFLGEYTGFLGLVRSWNGMWEMRTVDVTVREGEMEEEDGS